MTDTEKRAIENQQKEIEGKNAVIDTFKHTEKVLTEQIDNQQKEIEDYKKLKKDIVNKIMFWDKEELPDNKKIISMIDTLMEEVSRLEDIEDRKIEVELDFVKEKRDKFWKDKIKEKIRELKTLYNCNFDTVTTSYEMFYFVHSYIDKVKNILQDLLEE